MSDDLKIALEQFAVGCISGHVSEWPQLKPACAWALKEIERKDAEIARLREIVRMYTAIVELGYRAECDWEVFKMAKEALSEYKKIMGGD